MDVGGVARGGGEGEVGMEQAVTGEGGSVEARRVETARRQWVTSATA